ncbi:Kiwa anti-phage protein KwaB-like domain-containing protein [Cloacibacillus sp.]|uniref:Kiwa anti-phage protein KwaB-like domain-containing protein n=1 Tax=Cloacibacillus sp. TaxID=2049023 RepID=UPI0025BB4E61|nr:Kiwa anti-phage protein KwaB-like domain-containing protein [Cloacibacillus sp.]MCC8058453.1 DUF4868 domain-containing protein [Cloacibacillus sp.]
MDRITATIKAADATMRIYLLKKIGYKGSFEAVVFPNSLDTEVREAYADNFETFIRDKRVTEYDSVHHEKGAIEKVELSTLDYWASMLAAMSQADGAGAVLTPENFSDDYSLIVLAYEKAVERDIQTVYLLAQYRKVDAWYKKSVKFGITANTFTASHDDVFVLNGCIDAAIVGSDVYVLQENQFEKIFNYYERSKKTVQSNQAYIQAWGFIDKPNDFFNSVQGKKGATTKLARALDKRVLDFSTLEPQTVKQRLGAYEEFAAITYNKQDCIVFSAGVRDLIIDIVRCAYLRGLFTDDVIYSKGV